MTTIGIVGFGYVGKAVEYGFRPKNKIVVHDKFLPSEPLENVVSNSDIVFVCVPTPMDGKYSRIDLSIVESVVGETVGLARKLGRKPIITIKSTVIPGTTRNLGKKFDWPEILFNPEFLTAKVIFANEMFDLCEQLGIKYEEMKKMVVADYRIFDSHLDITTQRGFGGKCFPKDTVALLGLARELGVELSVLETAWKKNLKIRKVRDWEEIPGAVSRKQRKQGESNT